MTEDNETQTETPASAKKPVKENQEEMLERMRETADRIEKSNKVLAALLEKQEVMKVEATLGGEADAGAQKKTVDEVQAEAAKDFLAGTGLADEAFPEEKK